VIRDSTVFLTKEESWHRCIMHRVIVYKRLEARIIDGACFADRDINIATNNSDSFRFSGLRKRCNNNSPMREGGGGRRPRIVEISTGRAAIRIVERASETAQRSFKDAISRIASRRDAALINKSTISRSACAGDP